MVRQCLGTLVSKLFIDNRVRTQTFVSLKFSMSTNQATSPSKVASAMRVQPPLSDEARAQFVELCGVYSTNLPKSQDSDNFHLETARLCMAVGVRPSCLSFICRSSRSSRCGALPIIEVSKT